MPVEDPDGNPVELFEPARWEHPESFMRVLPTLTMICTASLAVASLTRGSNPLDEAVRAMGAESATTLQFTASGATFTVGQNFSPTDPWPRVTLKRYTASIDYKTGSMAQDVLREMGTTMPRGGGVPFTGELHQIQHNDAHAVWNIPIPANSSAGSLPTLPCTLPEDGGTAPQSAPAPDSQVPCAVMLWTTPHGFLRAAQAHHATVTPTDAGVAVSFVIAVNHTITGVIDARLIAPKVPYAAALTTTSSG